MEQSSSNFETTAEAPGEEWLTVHRLSERTENVGEMVVASEELRKVLKTITKLSPYRQTVLVEGESGTGTDLIARALHSFGGASNGPFVIFNCSNLVASLAEAQLFGHVKGAYTDAREDALGYFRSANGGTLFLR
jgi:transcriptional regulator with GAF, ATPase, and Fis domain